MSFPNENRTIRKTPGYYDIRTAPGFSKPPTGAPQNGPKGSKR